jgi:Zn finger protein HypA/HybF involved in hydrogenase expression
MGGLLRMPNKTKGKKRCKCCNKFFEPNTLILSHLGRICPNCYDERFGEYKRR